jgi:hypothetical protein
MASSRSKLRAGPSLEVAQKGQESFRKKRLSPAPLVPVVGKQNSNLRLSRRWLRNCRVVTNINDDLATLR